MPQHLLADKPITAHGLPHAADKGRFVPRGYSNSTSSETDLVEFEANQTLDPLFHTDAGFLIVSLAHHNRQSIQANTSEVTRLFESLF
jgi:hypothetical protein